MIIIKMLSVASSSLPVAAVISVFADGCGAPHVIAVTISVPAPIIPITVTLSAVVTTIPAVIFTTIARQGARPSSLVAIISPVHRVAIAASVVREHRRRVFLFLDVWRPAPKDN